MIGFCGALTFSGDSVRLTELKRMSGLHGAGCAFVCREFGVLCDGERSFLADNMPLTIECNGGLYTVAMLSDRLTGKDKLARSVIERYIEEGDEYLKSLEYSYALALYDGRCGELWLSKGYRGDKPLFYSVRGETVYFASSLLALMRLWGGCVRVSKKELKSHLSGEYGEMPYGLFCDIRPVRAGHSLICSRFGQSEIATPQGVYSSVEGEPAHCKCVPDSQDVPLRRVLTDSLFAFGYPQFDCYMPRLWAYLLGEECRRRGAVCICDVTRERSRAYSTERAERLGRAAGVRITLASAADLSMGRRILKNMNRELDVILSEYLLDKGCVLYSLFDSEYFDALMTQRPSEETLRLKGMLCQTAMWRECFNIVFV